MKDFALHPRLAADTVTICDWPLSRVLLMNDGRFPWLILVPRRAGIAEFFSLPSIDRNLLADEISRASAIVRRWAMSRAGCDKLNVGMIGNIVRQLHVHVIARRTTDAAWPFPVWGRGDPVPYPPGEFERAAAELNQLALNTGTVPP
ncbi:MAG TPA: HIT domain-containing protein [Micropepsaceae bacterium]|nr:HIT domain-containing protein [Micropepsaceae bacterium]